jgi:hypothetical protein
MDGKKGEVLSLGLSSDNQADSVNFNPFNRAAIGGKISKTRGRGVVGNLCYLPQNGPQIPFCETLFGVVGQIEAVWL